MATNKSYTVGNGTTGSVGYTDKNQEIERTKSVLQYRQSQGMDTSAQQAWYKKLTGTDYATTPTVQKTNTTTTNKVTTTPKTTTSTNKVTTTNNSNYTSSLGNTNSVTTPTTTKPKTSVTGKVATNGSTYFDEWNAKNNPTGDASKGQYVYMGNGSGSHNWQYLKPGQSIDELDILRGTSTTYDYGELSDPEKWVNEGLVEGEDWWYNPVTHNAQLMSDFRNGTSQGTPTSLSDNRAPTFDFSSHSLDDLKKMLADSGYTPNYTPEQYTQYQQDFASQPYGKVFDPNKYNGSMVNREDYIYDALYRYLNSTWGGQV